MGIGISATTDPNPHCFRISDPPFSFYLDPDTEIGGPGCRKKYLFHLFLIIFENLDLSYIFLMVRIRNFYKSLEPELEFSKRSGNDSCNADPQHWSLAGLQIRTELTLIRIRLSKKHRIQERKKQDLDPDTIKWINPYFSLSRYFLIPLCYGLVEDLWRILTDDISAKIAVVPDPIKTPGSGSAPLITGI